MLSRWTMAGYILAATFTQAVIADAQTFPFEMQQQPLSAALREYARVSDQQIIFTNDIVAGRSAPALHGTHAADDALEQLLAGTGLKAERSTSGAIMVMSASGAAAAAPGEGARGVRLAALAAQTAAAPPGARVVSTPAPHAAAASAADHQVFIEEVIVTAQKRRQSINTVGMSVTAVSGEQLTNLGVRGPEDLQNAVVGLSYSRVASGPPIFSIRGIGFPEVVTAGAPGVSTYLDEAPMPYSLMSLGAALDVQRVEVMKGPQGTLFGQNVTGGAINFIANRPTEEFKVGADVSYGSYEQLLASAFISGGLGDRVRARLALGTDQMGDWQKSYTRDDEFGRSRLYMGRLLIDWDATDSLALQLGVNGWSDKSDEQASQFLAVNPPRPFPPPPPAYTNIFLPAAARYPTPTDARFADWNPEVAPYMVDDPITGAHNDSFSRDNDYLQGSLRADWTLGDSTVLTSISSYQELNQKALADVDGTDVHNWVNGTGTQIDVFFQELRLAGDAGKLDWLVGANYMDESIHGYASVFSLIGTFPFRVTSSIGDTDSRTWAVFAHTEYSLTDTLTAVAGVRYTDVSTSNDSCTYFPAPTVPPTYPCSTRNANNVPGIIHHELDESNVPFTLGLNWMVRPDSLLYLNVSQGYKAGGFTLSGAQNYRGFAPATQESVLAYETGFKLGLADNHVQLNGAVFYYDYEDKQVRGVYVDPVIGPVNKLINIPKSAIEGGELDFTWVPDQHWRFNVGAAYTHTEIQDGFTNYDALGRLQNLDGTMLPFTPEWQVLGDLEFKFALTSELGAFMGAHARYQTESFAGLGENAILAIDGYTNLDLRLGVRSNDGRWSLAAFAQNATNEYSWRSANATTDAIIRTANLPRIYGLRLSLRL